MALSALNPWQVLDQLQNESTRRYSQRQWQPLVDISENSTAYTITAELPGVDPQAVKVELEDNTLKISGDKSRKTEDGIEYRYRERATGAFARAFKLPKDADSNNIQARFELGLLVIQIAKREQSQPRKIEIQI